MTALNTLTATIDLATTPATRAGFGTQIFISSHKFFRERTRSYGSLTEASGLPTNSDEYLAIARHFAQQPVHPIKLGRRETATATLTPINVSTGAVYSATLNVNDGDSVDITYTAVGGDTPADVATQFFDQIQNNVAASAHVTATDNSGSVTITEDTASDFFFLTDLTSNLTYIYNTTETPADTLNAIDLEDMDYYGVCSNIQDQATVELLATAVTGRSKLFLHCTDDVNALTSWNGTTSGVDILADLLLGSNQQVVPMYHHDLTLFPEVGVFAFFAGRGLQPGTIAWNWKSIQGVGPAEDGNGNVLTGSQITNLKRRNAGTFERSSVGTIFGQGAVSSGTGDGTGIWIEHVVSKDFLIARLVEGFATKFRNLNKISLSDLSITSQRATMSTILDRYVETEALPNILAMGRPYELNFPRRADLSFSQIASQTLPTSGHRFFLSGTNTSLTISATLTYDADV